MKSLSTRKASVACAALSCLLTACATFAPPERGTEELPVPDSFTLYEETAPAPGRWWESFESEELGQLVERSLAGNLTLRQIYARLSQAKMLARQAGAGRWPELGYTGDVSAARSHIDTGQSINKLEVLNQKLGALDTLLGSSNGGGTPAPTDLVEGLDALSAGAKDTQTRLQALATLLASPPSSEMTVNTESYRFGLGSSYEVDIWGRVRARQQAALLDYEAWKEDLYGAMLSLSGTVVLRWLEIVAYQQELALVDKQLELNRTTLELMRLRYRKGLATALDVYQQRQIVAQTESLVPPFESGVQTARHELAALLGEQPRADLGIEKTALPEVGALPEAGLPMELLANRPDIRAWGLLLRSADWRVSAARADRLPSLRLTASASYGAEKWGLVFDNWMATLAGSVTGPIFDAGRRTAEVERTRAVVDERLAGYQESVLVAVKEVENAMLQETKQAEYVDALRRELDAAQSSHQQALERYRKGLNDYLPVLSALAQLQVLERRMVQAELTRITRRVQLCIALGGTWMEEEFRGSTKTVADIRPSLN